MWMIDGNKLKEKAVPLLWPTTMEPCGHLPNPVMAVVVDEIEGMLYREGVELPEPARWEPSPVMPGYVRCSGCHNCHVADDWLDGKKWKHCPECGAPMENGGPHG